MHFFPGKRDKENKGLIEQIILKNYNKYYRLAYGYVHNEDDAYDIVQSGAYQALRGSHTLHQPEYAETWVYRIMLNESFRYLKKPQLLSYEAVCEESGTEAGAVEDRYTDMDLRRALDALPGKDKAVVIMKYYEDMKLEEIAGVLEENVNTVKSRLYRSLRKLREALSDGENQNAYALHSGSGR